jgi:hypothetical protein
MNNNCLNLCLTGPRIRLLRNEIHEPTRLFGRGSVPGRIPNTWLIAAVEVGFSETLT